MPTYETQRVIAGLSYAQAHGTKTGKPVGRPRAVFRRDQVVRLRKEEKLSWNQIAKRMKISSGSARRAYLADSRTENPEFVGLE